MKRIRIFASFFALAMLSGCAGSGNVSDIESLREADATGDSFTRQLTGEYRQITLFEQPPTQQPVDRGQNLHGV